MPHVYSAEIHTPDRLADELSALDNAVITGSVGRCAVLGDLKPIRRSDGYALDIDALPFTPDATVKPCEQAAFEVDTKLSRIFRPHGTDWGLFLLETDSEPIYTIPGEVCEARTVALPWKNDRCIKVLPLAVETQMIGITGAKYFKNKQQSKQLFKLADVLGAQLPASIANDFEEFKRLRAHIEKYGAPGYPYSKAERIYRALRQGYLHYCPGAAKEVIEQNLGDAMRRLRGTDTTVVRPTSAVL